MFIDKIIKVVAIVLLPFISIGQNYYNVYFLNKNDTIVRGLICAGTISNAKLIALEMSKDYNCAYKVVYWKRRPKSDTRVNYLIWK